MENNFEMRLTSMLSNVIIKEVSQKLANQLLAKFKEQTKDDDQKIMALITKFDQYKEGLDIDKRDITKYSYDALKSLILGKEIEKASDKALTQLKKKYDRYREQGSDDEAARYRYESSTLKSLVKKFFDIQPYLQGPEKDIMKYDYLSLYDFIRKNYGKIINKIITKNMSNDPDFAGGNPETLLFYINSFIQNRDRVPRGTKPVGLMNFHELEHLVDGALSQGDDNADKDKSNFDDIDRVYDKNNLIVFSPKSKDQCVRLKNGRTWCTSREGSGNLYYNYRLNNERTLYYVIDEDKPFSDLNYAVVILVDPYGRMALADKSNSGRYSGHQNIPWSEIEEKIPKLKGLQSLFEPKPLTDAEKELINKVRNTRVGENPYESLGDEQTVEMWLEYVTPTLSDEQFGNLSPDLQKKYIALGFDLDYGKLKNASEGVLSYYVNKKKEKLMRTPFSQLTDKDLDLLDLPMMKKLKEQLKSTFVESLLSGGKSSNKLELEYPKDAASKYIKLYGLDELIDNLPDDLEVFDFNNSTNSPMNLNLPDSFKKFKNLGTFHVRNALNEVPEVLKGMNSLDFIALPDSPNIHSVPEWIADLPNLLALTFYGGDQNLEIGPKVRQKMLPKKDGGNGLHVLWKDED